jgi:diguanylate cyclase (GGDEF)-like protein
MHPWSDRLIPDVFQDDAEGLSRARLTVSLSTVRAGAVIVGAGVTLLPVSLLVLRRWPRLHIAGHFLTAVLYGVLVGLICHEGGLRAFATPWLATPPIFAILVQGRRGALLWTVVSVLTVLAFGAAEWQGARFPVDYPAAWATRIEIATLVGLIVSAAILIFVFEGIRAAAQARAESASTALARLAYQDALTGLANRARFLECLDAALGRARAAGDLRRVGVLLLDLDGFKSVNDSMGHAAGDLLLVEVAGRLLSATRGCDTVARLGGDEFAVVLDGLNGDDDAAVVADRIVASVAEPFALSGRRACVGVSVGIARATRDTEVASLLHEADVAMYRAKALGKGRWVSFERAPNAARRDVA